MSDDEKQRGSGDAMSAEEELEFLHRTLRKVDALIEEMEGVQETVEVLKRAVEREQQ